MEDKLFSSKLKEVNLDNYGANVIGVVEELRRLLGNEQLKVYEWNSNYIAFSFNVNVNKPSRGTVNNLDIRDKEPILLLIHKTNYPYECPRVRLNRMDFPSKNVPHLNPVQKGQPSSICFHRGNVDDWFTEHTIKDLIHRIKNWLRDAARNRLILEEDLFEFTRVEETLGVAIYDNQTLLNYIHKFWLNNEGKAGFAFLWMELIGQEESYEANGANYPVRLKYIIYTDAEEIRDIAIQLCELDKNRKTKDLIGILVFPNQTSPSSQYISLHPTSLADLMDIGNEFGLPIQNSLDEYYQRKLQVLNGIPLIATILRPKNIIGTGANIEFIHFLLSAHGDYRVEDGLWKLDTPVHLLQHRKPLTVQLARDISTTTGLGGLKIAVIGCGAVGSKVALHFARSGQTKLLLIDSDELSPHNMVRHGLLPDSVGLNKSEALKTVIEDMYKQDSANAKVEMITETLHTVVGTGNEQLEGCHSIIDCTASSNVLDILTDKKLSKIAPIIRCEITDRGRIGICYAEGQDRNPRVDDLQASLFDLAIENDKVSKWLINHRAIREELVGPALQDIDIGMSCSSSTMRLADDLISYHSASFSMGIKKRLRESRPELGNIQFSYFDNNNGILGQVFEFQVGRVIVFQNGQGSNSWEVRVNSSVVDFMTERLRTFIPSETGGILIGFLQPKRKIIYVTRALDAPPDSKASPYAFVRGISDSPEILDEIGRISGGMLGYVGEWHTHPLGGIRLSKTDIDSMKKIKTTLDKVSLPTHVMVVTPRAVASYIL